MSRRSLYRQSSRHSAGPYPIDLEERITHWSLQWTSPLLPQTSSAPQPPTKQGQSTPRNGQQIVANGVAEPAAGLDDATKSSAPSRYPFEVRAWLQIDDSSYKPVEDGEESDMLDIQLYTVAPPEPAAPVSQEGALTAADIRGAVGGEAIPGMSAPADGTPDTPVPSTADNSAQPAEQAAPTAEPAQPAAKIVAEPVAAEPVAAEPTEESTVTEPAAAEPTSEVTASSEIIDPAAPVPADEPTDPTPAVQQEQEQVESQPEAQSEPQPQPESGEPADEPTGEPIGEPSGPATDADVTMEDAP